MIWCSHSLLTEELHLRFIGRENSVSEAGLYWTQCRPKKNPQNYTLSVNWLHSIPFTKAKTNKAVVGMFVLGREGRLAWSGCFSLCFCCCRCCCWWSLHTTRWKKYDIISDNESMLLYELVAFILNKNNKCINICSNLCDFQDFHLSVLHCLSFIKFCITFHGEVDNFIIWIQY